VPTDCGHDALQEFGPLPRTFRLMSGVCGVFGVLG
jgi:hypothetical protein